MKPAVFISIPNLGELRTELAITLLRWFTSGQYRLKLFAPMHIQPHHRARNVCVREFLRDEYDWLFFIDADCAPPPEALDRLLSHGVDFVSGVVLTWKDGGPVPVALRWNEERTGYRPVYGHGLTEVDATTLACTLLSRRLVEAIGLPAFSWADNAEGTDGFGEDFVFCQRAQEAGFRIYCDFSLIVGHLKTLELLEVSRLLAREERCRT